METILDPPHATVTVRQTDLPTKSTASWSAIFAGALVAIAVSVVLSALGSGLGFAEISPWQGQGVTAKTFAVTTAIWFIVMQWLSSAAGGYIAGRLRTRWHGTHAHEIFFRDSAHGFVTWALATAVVAGILLLSVTSTLGAGARAASAVASTSASNDTGANTPLYAYAMDKLFRPADPASTAATATAALNASAPEVHAQVAHVVAQALLNDGSVPDADRTYLASLVAARTGVSADEAQRRVSDFIMSANQAKDQVKATADAARKLAARTAIFAALAMVIGAFIASITAVVGGRLRDEHP